MKFISYREFILFFHQYMHILSKNHFIYYIFYNSIASIYEIMYNEFT